MPTTAFCDPCFPMALQEFNNGEARKRRAFREKEWHESVGATAFTDTQESRLPDQRALQKVKAWKPEGRGLIIFGGTGMGKTRMLWLLLHRLYVEDGVLVEFVRASRFGRIAGDFDKGNDYIKGLARVPILALDDLGKETPTLAVEGALLELLELRMGAGRPTLITTQFQGESLLQRFKDQNTGDAIVRRLREEPFFDSIYARQPDTAAKPKAA